MNRTRAIKDFALDLGYHAVGIATAEPFLAILKPYPLWLQHWTTRLKQCAGMPHGHSGESAGHWHGGR